MAQDQPCALMLCQTGPTQWDVPGCLLALQGDQALLHSHGPTNATGQDRSRLLRGTDLLPDLLVSCPAQHEPASSHLHQVTLVQPQGAPAWSAVEPPAHHRRVRSLQSLLRGWPITLWLAAWEEPVEAELGPAPQGPVPRHRATHSAGVQLQVLHPTPNTWGDLRTASPGAAAVPHSLSTAPETRPFQPSRLALQDSFPAENSKPVGLWYLGSAGGGFSRFLICHKGTQPAPHLLLPP